ncbi:DUF805 domain-containing protein [uncultured Polaribacter sp.]|uniref:DUF805 domain-containing protein n=1 Tax=uncultured Polaribacter sp. TaxID=174711 RepID=UPI002607CF8E|nr:DUF805 domain-containing protein [uncultured Polaribacter sp.]
MNWYLKVLKQYADFSGRARRKEFWFFNLIHYSIIAFLIFLIFFVSDNFEKDPDTILFVITALYFIATLIPLLAVTVRRLHDMGQSGWWYLINFVPYIGSFVLLIFTCMDSVSKPNKWGDNPKGKNNFNAIDQIGKE